MKWVTRIILGTATVLVFGVSGGVALSWAPDRPVESLKARWAQPPSEFIRVEGMDVHLRDEGPRDDPDPIVLLHGTSASLHTWDGWVAGLKSDHRVVRFDPPGFGLTGPNPSGKYDIETYRDFTLDVLRAKGLSNCVVAGNSFGGHVAWEAALAAPDLVAKLVLVDSAGYPNKPKSIPIGFRIAMIPGLNRVMLYVLPRGIIESSLRNVYGDPAKVTPELITRYYELALREGNRDALPRRFAQAPSGVNSGRIREITQPTLIIWGGQDRTIPPQHAQHFHSDIAGSELRMFGFLGHVPHEENPVDTVASVEEYLARQAEMAAAKQAEGLEHLAGE